LGKAEEREEARYGVVALFGKADKKSKEKELLLFLGTLAITLFSGKLLLQ